MLSQSRATRVIAGLALAGVSLIAAIVSYLHGLEVVQAVGAKPPVSYLIPFLADLVILGASASIVNASQGGRGWPPLAVVSALAGIGVTLAMNVAAGWSHGTGGRLVAGWPAVAFILALESLAGIVRRGRGVSPVPGAPATSSHDEPGPVDVADTLQRLVDHFGSQRAAAAELRIPRDHLRRLLPVPVAVEDTAAMNGDGHGG